MRSKSEGMDWTEYQRCIAEAGPMLANKELRQKVLEKTGGHCFYCGKEIKDNPGKLHVDHFVPLRAGGKNIFSNFVPACPGCNTRKNGKTINEWRDSLRKKIQETKLLLSYLESFLEQDAFWFERYQISPDKN
jgi:5-methylcytosine-specific restriction endonuclease McrA